MPSNYPAILFGAMPLLKGGPDPRRTHNAFQRFESQIWCERALPLYGIQMDPIPCIIEHYVTDSQLAPLKNALAQCSGSFKVVSDGAINTIVLKTFRLQCYPGDVDDPNYISSCPSPSHVQVTVVGLVGDTHQPTSPSSVVLREFELQTSVWDATQQTVAFSLSCLFPDNKRWENTRMPSRGSVVSVTGEVIGVDKQTGQVAVLLQAFDYISSRGTEPGAQKLSPKASGQGGPSTTKGAHWGAWAGSTSPPSKKPEQPNRVFRPEGSTASATTTIKILEVSSSLLSIDDNRNR